MKVEIFDYIFIFNNGKTDKTAGKRVGFFDKMLPRNVMRYIAKKISLIAKKNRSRKFSITFVN